jgi:hypothetical protein
LKSAITLCIAKDADGGSSESDIWSFTTIDDSPVNIEYGSFEDARDDKVYQTIDIGDQIWMALAQQARVESAFILYRK